jgi:hypothetical protein
MAKRTLNRRQLRREADDAERAEPLPAAVAPAEEEPAEEKVKAPAKPKPKRPSKKKAPARMRARWGVFDGGMKRVAVFDYNQRGAADAKVSSLNAAKPGQFFLQIVKEPMPEPEPSAEPEPAARAAAPAPRRARRA